MRWLAGAFAVVAACGARTGLAAPTSSTPDGVDVEADVAADAIGDQSDAFTDAIRDASDTHQATEVVLLDRCDGPDQIVVRFDPDTGVRERLFTPPTDYLVGPNGLVASPDGQRFAWAGYEASGGFGWRIYVQDGSTGTPQRITWSGLPPGSSPDAPAWSPDGTMFAFSLQSSSGTFTIRLAPANDGSALAATSQNDIRTPAWSSDGTWISAIGVATGAPLPVWLDRADAAVFTDASSTYASAAAAFTADDLFATVDTQAGRNDLVLHSVPSGVEAARFALPSDDLVTAIAAEPDGNRIAINSRARLLVLDRSTGEVSALYDPPGCMLVQNGLSWVLRPD